MRTTTGTVTVLGAAAALFIVLGVAGLTLVARRSGDARKLANAGLIAAAAGFAILLVGSLIQAVFYRGDFPWMPFLVIPGVLAVMLGFVLIGVFILRSGLFPRWLGIVLVLSSVLLPAANAEKATVLLAVPFGLAISTAGFFLWNIGGRLYAGTTASS